MYWALGVGSVIGALQLSGSSLFTLGFAPPHGVWMSALALSEAMLGLIMVALLIAYLPTMYAAFSRREQAVNMLEVRAGSPPSALEMLMRFNRIQGLEQLADYWRTWEGWFADIEESHSTLAALVFFRSPRSDVSWVTAAGTVLDAASLTLSAVDVPYEPQPPYVSAPVIWPCMRSLIHLTSRFHTARTFQTTPSASAGRNSMRR